MSVIDTLVTDRTQEDVNLIKELLMKGPNMTDEELAYFLGTGGATPKGAYNYTDLNRVNLAMAYLVNEFDILGYIVPDYEPQGITWSRGDIPTASELAAYLANVKAVRARIPIYPDSPELPETMAGLNYEKANAIEKVLENIESCIQGMMAAWYYSADLYGGEV